MKYLLMIYNNPATYEAWSEDQRNELFTTVDVIMKELTESGELISGQGLADASTAKTVRVRNGVPATTDGPFAEAKEQLGGYLIVQSGFPITGLLVNNAASGPRALVTFYARRMRRLLPAALVVLVVTSLAWNAVATSVEREPIIGDVRSAALYFSNWHFAAQATDYFASTDAPSPVIHFWSLSAEEQFYFVWPALVVVIFAIYRRDPRRSRRC